MLAWAGPIAEDLTLDTSILHLAPVARETPGHWRGRAGFLGLTPQGLVRAVGQRRARRSIAASPPPGAAAVAGSCHAIVINEHERASCASLIARASAAGAVVAVTAGAAPITDPRARPPGARAGGARRSPPAPSTISAPETCSPLLSSSRLSDGRAALDAARFANAAAAVRMQGAGAGAIGGLADDRGAAEGSGLRVSWLSFSAWCITIAIH